MRFALLLLLGSLCALRAARHELWISADQGASFRQLQAPTEARINSIALTGSSLHLATDQGLYLSDNLGKEWRQTVELGNSRVLSLSAAGTQLLAGTSRALWFSTNSGARWHQVEDIPGPVLSLAWSGTNAFAGFDSGEVLSSTGLRRWASLKDGLPRGAQVFELHPGRNGELFAALYSRGLWHWDRRRWRKLGDVQPLAMWASDSSLLAGHNPGGLFRSTDQGETWSAVTKGLPRNAPSWTLHKAGGVYFYGTSGASGLYRSLDDGLSWLPVHQGLFNKTGVVALASLQNLVVAATVTAKLRPGISDPFENPLLSE